MIMYLKKNALMLSLVASLVLTACGSGTETNTENGATSPSAALVIGTFGNNIPLVDGAKLEAKSGLYFEITFGENFSGSVTATSEGGSLPAWLHLDETNGKLFGIASSKDIVREVTVNDNGQQSLGGFAPFEVTLSAGGNTAVVSISVTRSGNLSDSDIDADNAFVNQLLIKESKFVTTDEVGYDAESGLSYDGSFIDANTLLPTSVKNISAASKESLHVNILAKAVGGDERAKLLIGGNNPEDAKAIALEILTNKISSYETFNSENPSFGGYLPWFIIANGKLIPASNWATSAPGLDNGQLAWSLYFAYNALEEQGETTLAARYKAHFDLMAQNVKKMYFIPATENNEALVASISAFPDVGTSPAEQTYTKTGGLTDQFEGELMVYFMTFFADLTDAEIDSIWTNKQIKSVEYIGFADQSYTVIEGWHFSSHEQWKYLVLPYLDDPKVREYFRNAEKVRADYSNVRGFDGFFASAFNSQLQYIDDVGIKPVASTDQIGTSIISTYGVYPMLIVDDVLGVNVGLDWLQHTLQFDNMVGDFGMSESFSNDDTRAIAPVLTWDGKVTTNLALLGGVYNEIRNYLIEDGLYDEFRSRLAQEFDKITSDIKGLDAAIQRQGDLPSVEIPIPEPGLWLDGFDENLGDVSWDINENGHVVLNEVDLGDGDIALDFTFMADGQDAVTFFATEPRDLTSYTVLSFDILVLDRGASAGEFMIKMEDGLSGSTGDVSIGIPDVGVWQSINIKLSTLEEKGIDLGYITVPMVIFPKWGDQQGVNFQLNNIRLSGSTSLYVFDDEFDSDTWDVGIFNGDDHAILTDVTLDDGNKIWELDYKADGGNTVTIIESSSENDVSGYYSLKFDLRVLDYGTNTSGFKLKLEGDGQTAEMFAGQPALNTWETIEITMADFTASGFDASRVKKIVFFPTWGDQQGVIFQVDNMRFAPAPLVADVFANELDSVWDIGVFSGDDHAVLTDVTLDDGNKVWNLDFKADGGNTVIVIESSIENDFSEFTALQFDLKVLNYGTNISGFKLKLEGDGQTPEMFAGQPDLDTWVTIKISMDDFTASGFDASRVKKIVFFPTWGDQQGVTFQVDNMKFIKEF
ncbi:MAG: hypothetical protein ACI88A_001161 [Paraglaciecola sp.]|jgi:hypothetical protein